MFRVGDAELCDRPGKGVERVKARLKLALGDNVASCNIAESRCLGSFGALVGEGGKAEQQNTISETNTSQLHPSRGVRLSLGQEVTDSSTGGEMA